jgi:hypothetical protein
MANKNVKYVVFVVHLKVSSKLDKFPVGIFWDVKFVA